MKSSKERAEFQREIEWTPVAGSAGQTAYGQVLPLHRMSGSARPGPEADRRETTRSGPSPRPGQIAWFAPVSGALPTSRGAKRSVSTGTKDCRHDYQDEDHVQHAIIEQTLTGRGQRVMRHQRRGERRSHLRQCQRPNRQLVILAVAEGTSHDPGSDPFAHEQSGNDAGNESEIGDDPLNESNRVDQEAGVNKENRDEQRLGEEVQLGARDFRAPEWRCSSPFPAFSPPAFTRSRRPAARRRHYRPYVLGFFGTDRPIADFMAELGKLLLMFFAGLEIDLALFRRARNRSIAFGHHHHRVSPGARHRCRPCVRLRRYSRDRDRIAARVAYPARPPVLDRLGLKGLNRLR